MARTITQSDVLNFLHNQMGHRVNPGGTDDDLKRYTQEAFEYCWRYYKWTFSLKTGTIGDDGLLPEDFDYEGYRSFEAFTEQDLADPNSTGTVAIVWDTDNSRYITSPVTESDITYQYEPPVLSDTGVPFPSVSVLAEGALIFAKRGENPTRADIQQEWDEWHSRLDRLVGRADNAKPRRPRSYHDVVGSYVGNVG